MIDHLLLEFLLLQKIEERNFFQFKKFDNQVQYIKFTERRTWVIDRFRLSKRVTFVCSIDERVITRRACAHSLVNSMKFPRLRLMTPVLKQGVRPNKTEILKIYIKK